MTLLKRDQEEGLITVNNQKKREREEGKSREGGWGKKNREKEREENQRFETNLTISLC